MSQRGTHGQEAPGRVRAPGTGQPGDVERTFLPTEGELGPQPGAETPGFRGAVGRKSGRPAPRIPHRVPAREATLAKFGLLTPGEANSNQGQLFDPKAYGEVSLEELARQRNLPPPQASSVGGFLPDIQGTAQKTAHERKVDALRNWADVRSQSEFPEPRRLSPAAVDRSTSPSQQQRHMADISRLAASSPEDVAWYGRYHGATPDAEGRVDPGDSNLQIDAAARRTGHSEIDVTRGVAVTSPQQPWNTGNALYPRLKNIGVVESVANTTQAGLRAIRGGGASVADIHAQLIAAGVSDKPRESKRKGTLPSHAEEASQVLSQQRGAISGEAIERLGAAAPGQGLSLGKGRAARALVIPGEAALPGPGDENQDKVRNFNESLLIGRQEVPRRLRAAYAGSSTEDVHHLEGRGYDADTFHNRQGTYPVEKMLETRMSFKNRQLPPHIQETTWVGRRDPEPLTSSLPIHPETGQIIPQGEPTTGAKYKAHPSLFKENKATGKLEPSFNLSGTRKSKRGERFELGGF